MPNEYDLAGILKEFARTMVTDFRIQAILDKLVKRIVEVMPISAAGVTLISAGAEAHYIAASDSSALTFEKLQTEVSEGPCLEAYRTGQAISVPDLREENRFPKFAPQALGAGLAAVFTFPLHHDDQRLGALDLYRDTPGSLSDEALAAAQTLADVTSAYLLNAQARADLKASSERSRQEALHDGLTGLANRLLLLERLEHALARGRRTGRRPGVLVLDLDRFKAVNDDYGHRIGDELLVAVAERLAGMLRSDDTLARLSGDEFVLLCEEVATPAQAENIAARIADVMADPFVVSGTEIDVTVSIGIALADNASVSPEQLLDDADRAMYRAKRQGGGDRRVLDLRDQHLAEYLGGVERTLEGSWARGELYVDYQPIVAAADGRITGVEALLRWAHPSRGLVSPTVFIPVAERSGFIDQVGRWVLEQAWADRSHWPAQPDGGDLSVAVNVSADQLMSARFAETVAAVLRSAPINPALLTLEVTESVFVRDPERAMVVLHQLKDLGVTLALDDFGTGHSSLSYLKRFPVDTVKIDRVFVADLGHDPASHTIVAAVVQLAHGLGMTVVAEGVETAEQYDKLCRLRTDSCQGFYFARPMSAATLQALVEGGEDGRQTRLPLLSHD
jgi:diguanylate cyclase (GGDEF)-like protein